MKKLILSVTVVFFTILLSAQNIKNIRQEIVGNQVKITYDLVSELEGQTFEIILFCTVSGNNYKQRLYFGKGDVGKDITVGKEKKIVWSNEEELSTFDMDALTFELESKVFNSSLFFTYPKEKGVSFKRDKVQKIQWIGGESNEDLVIELFRYDIRKNVVAHTSNKGNVLWSVPKNISPGDDYQFRMHPISKPNLSILSEKFRIRRKIPTGIKVLGGAIVASTIGYFIFKKSNVLPGAPNPPNKN